MDIGQVQKIRKLMLVAVSVPVAVVLILMAPIWPEDGFVTEMIEAIGVVCILICVVGRCWSALYIGSKKSVELTVAGPYAMTRNPLYLFTFIGAAGIGMTTGTLVGGVLLALLVYLIFSQVVAREEQFLLGLFGQPYADYCRQVPRFWPRLDLLQPLERELTIHLPALRKTLMDAILFLVAVPFFEFIEWLHEWGVVPVILYLP